MIDSKFKFKKLFKNTTYLNSSTSNLFSNTDEKQNKSYN